MEQTRHNLPTFPTPFIGRADEIAELSQLLDTPDCHLLTLVGPGGIGKTRLAIEVARRILDTFLNGVYFVPLQPLQAADQVVPAVIDALPLQVTGDPTQQLLAYLRDKHLLLLLDNFEHVLASAALVGQILAEAPQVTMLVSSREVLKLQGEWVRAVTGLTYPDNGGTQDGNHYSALDLFTERAHRLSGDFSLDNEREHVVRICQLVEGMPLGIELAAGWTTALSCAEIAAEIQRGLDFLTTDIHNLPERHRSMQAVFDHSWGLLAEDEQFVMRRFAVFRGGCTREAAEQITGATLKTLASLLAKSMLRCDRAQRRYDVQELLRQYAHEQLVAIGDYDAASKAHCRYYADFMAQRAADVKGRRQLEALGEIEVDWNNVRTAWSRALGYWDWESVGQMMETLHLFCDMRARYADGDTLFQAALDALEPSESDEPHPLWGELLVRAAAVFSLPTSSPPVDMVRVSNILERARQEAHMGDDPLYLWACGYFNHSFPAKAFALLEASLAGFHARDDRYYVGRALRLLAWTCVMSRDFADHFASYNREYLALTHEIGDETGLAHALCYEGEFARNNKNQLDEAERYFHEAGAIWRRMGDWKSVGIITGGLGGIAFRRGDFERAKPLLREAVQLGSEVNFLWTVYRALDLLGIIACFEGDCVTARQILTAIPPNVFPGLGRFVAACGLGDYELLRGYLRAELHEYATRPLFELDRVRLYPMAAMLLAHEGEPEWAVELLARQTSERAIPMRYMLPMVSVKNWALLAQVRDDLERQLGATAFEAAWKRGETLDIETTTRQLLAYLGDEPTPSQTQANQTLAEPLTEREREVLSLLAQGRSNRQIAETLVIAVGTVKRYVYTICQKLAADNRTHAVARARELGLL